MERHLVNALGLRILCPLDILALAVVCDNHCVLEYERTILSINGRKYFILVKTTLPVGIYSFIYRFLHPSSVYIMRAHSL